MTYDERMVVFIDILGFKDIVSQSVNDEDLLLFIHESIKSISGCSVENDTYKNVPWVPVENNNGNPNVITPKHQDFDKKVRSKWPILITHFSDCIVMSAPVSINGSCNLLIRAINELMYSFFDRGILLRGGISIGKLIHENSGVLFGPGLIEAYQLESKEAKYPRIVVSKCCREKFEEIFHAPYLELFNESSDGYLATNVLQVIRFKLLSQGEFSFDDTESKIAKLLASVENKDASIKEKVSYIASEWKLCKLEIYKDLGIDPTECT